MHKPKLTNTQTVITKWFTSQNCNWRTINTIPQDGAVIPGDSDHFQCIRIVLSENSSPEMFANLTHRTDLHRGFWLTFINENLENFFQNAYLPFSLNMLAARVTNNTHAEIYDVYRVDQTRPIRVKFFGNWTKQDGFVVKEEYIYRRRYDLEAITLRVGTIENWPISYHIENNTWKGFFPGIWRQIEEFTNMKSVIIKHNSTGSRENNQWSGLMGMAVDGKIDAIVSELTLDVNRNGVLDFSQPLLKASYQIFFKRPGFVLGWDAVFRPFPGPLWMAILAWIIFSSIAFFLLDVILVKFRIETTCYSIVNCLLFNLQALSQQGRDKVPRSLASRILFLSTYVFATVVLTAYSASLISSLTLKTPYRPFDSITEMLQEGSFKLLVPPNTAEYDFFANANDRRLIQAFDKHIKTVSKTLVMRSVKNASVTICKKNNYAMFGIDSIVSRKLLQQPRPFCKIISMTQPVRTVHVGIAMPKNHQMFPIVKYHLGLMIERGIVRRIQAATWPLNIEKATETWTEVHLEEVFQIFTFLACGMILSLVCLFFELQFVKTRRRPLRFDLEFIN